MEHFRQNAITDTTVSIVGIIVSKSIAMAGRLVEFVLAWELAAVVSRDNRDV